MADIIVVLTIIENFMLIPIFIVLVVIATLLFRVRRSIKKLCKNQHQAISVPN